MNATTQRREKATNAFIAKMHRLWHEARGMKPCAALQCEHPWAPR